MKKRWLTILLAFAMILSMTSISAFAADSNNEREQMGVLFYEPENIKIYAKLSDLRAFLRTPVGDERNQALRDLMSDPTNKVDKLGDMPFEMISTDSDDGGIQVMATRSPGTWSIPAFNIASGSIMSLGPSGAPAFDVAYNEFVEITYYCSPDRLISVMLATSLPSTFYDPGYYSGTTILMKPNSGSGQYRIYLKNYDGGTASITGGTIKIYT